MCALVKNTTKAFSLKFHTEVTSYICANSEHLFQTSANLFPVTFPEKQDAEDLWREEGPHMVSQEL
jgi:hypothetical protein